MTMEWIGMMLKCLLFNCSIDILHRNSLEFYTSWVGIRHASVFIFNLFPHLFQFLFLVSKILIYWFVFTYTCVYLGSFTWFQLLLIRSSQVILVSCGTTTLLYWSVHTVCNWISKLTGCVASETTFFCDTSN